MNNMSFMKGKYFVPFVTLYVSVQKSLEVKTYNN